MKPEVAIRHMSISCSGKNQRGLSLVELMVAIALGLFLTWGAIQAFLTGKQTYSMQQGLSRIQENGRMAQEFLSFDIRNAGNIGCGSQSLSGEPNTSGCVDGVNMLTDTTTVEFDFGKSVYGVDNVDGTEMFGETFNNNQGLKPAPLKGTDVLVARGSTDSGVTLTQPGKAGSANLDITVTSADGNGCFSGMCPDDILVVSDCTKAKIFQATALQQDGELMLHSKSGENACAAWGGVKQSQFNVGARVMKMHSRFYYVANSPVTGRPGLYVQGITGAAQELLEGIENMQLEFGVDDNGDFTVDRYLDASQVSDGMWDGWEDSNNSGVLTDDPRVRSVRYSLLIRTEDNVLAEPQKYTYNGTDVTATDRRLRQIFTSTVGIRNRLK